MMKEHKHKLIVFGSDWDVYTHAFRDFIENQHIHYIPTFRPSGISGIIQRLHLNPNVNKRLPLPAKHLWSKYIINQVRKETLKNHAEEIPCFLILENWLRLESALKLLPTLRKQYPNSKIVCFTQDLITRIDDMYTNEHVDVQYVKKFADLCITYDSNDAQKYNLHYFPTVFSLPTKKVSEVTIERDFYFLGRDKGRLTLLKELEKAFSRIRLKSDFIILEENKQHTTIQEKGISYTATPLTYAQNLQLVATSNCIIELLQENAASATFRLWEAIVYNKKLLTNNIAIKESPFYDPRYISTFTSIEDIDWTFVKDISKPAYADENPYNKFIQPKALLEFIENSLDINLLR